MKEYGIIFQAAMVRAILAGTKTQTRRVVKPQPYIDDQGNACWNGLNFGQDSRGPHIQALASPLPSSKTGRVRCPYGQPGDRLWVRETYCEDPLSFINFYRADGELDQAAAQCGAKWRPAIHMYRRDSRIALEITAVRVERLQDISEADAIAEGLFQDTAGRWTTYSATEAAKEHLSPVQAYRDLWEQINGPGSWDVNPWLWVLEFKRLKGGAP